MSRPLALLLIGLSVAAGAGCRSNTDRVESALRSTEECLRETKDQLQRQGTYTNALEHELRILRGEVHAGQPGQPVAVFPVRQVVLGRQTGGHDSASGQGDDGLQVIIEPQNAEGRPIQVPGDAMLQVLEVTTEGHKRLLSSWYIDKDQMKASWRMGLLSQGYNLILPWKVLPGTEKLRLALQFRLEDGRVFEADRDVTVRLPRGAAARPSTTVVSPEPPVTTLPPPKAEPTPRTPTPIPEPPVPIPEMQKKPDVPDGPILQRPGRTDPAVRPAVELGKPARDDLPPL